MTSTIAGRSKATTTSSCMPPQATLLAGLAARLGARPLKRFRYRAVQPNLLGTPLTVNAAPRGEGIALWTALPDGGVSVQAEAAY